MHKNVPCTEYESGSSNCVGSHEPDPESPTRSSKDAMCGGASFVRRWVVALDGGGVGGGSLFRAPSNGRQLPPEKAEARVHTDRKPASALKCLALLYPLLVPDQSPRARSFRYLTLQCSQLLKLLQVVMISRSPSPPPFRRSGTSSFSLLIQTLYCASTST